MQREWEPLWMRKNLPICDHIDIVFSKDEFGFQEVIDAFPRATRVAVVTFNISKYSSRLMRAIKQLAPEVEVKIVTNIPSRFSKYTSDKAREKASENIEIYLDRLNPVGYVQQLKSFFQYDNHCKLIATDEIAYLGSSNFSDESANNFECGIIIRDPRLVQRLVNEMCQDLIATADEHGGNALATAIIQLNVTKKGIAEAKTSLHDLFYIPPDWDYGEIPEHFNWQDCEASRADLDAIESMLDELEMVLQDVRDVPGAEGIIDTFNREPLDEIRRRLATDEPLDLFLGHDSQAFSSDYLENQIYDDYDEACQEATNEEGEQRRALAAR